MVKINSDDLYLIDGSLDNYLIVIDNSVANIKYDIKKDTKIIILNNYDGEVSLNDYGTIRNSANVDLAYFDLNKTNYNQDSKIEVYEGSSLNIVSKFLTVTNKNIKLNYINCDPHTSITIDNSCVCTDASNLVLECIGKINKNAKASKNLQSSRCLTIDNPKKALIKPVLLIDENDVMASHSLSSGTIDQDILYYLNSRGISHHDAMLLFIHSYLLPQDNMLETFKDKDYIMQNITDKVVNLYV